MHAVLRLLFGLAVNTCLFAAEPAAYDPLKVPDVKIVSKALDVKDAKRDRVIPVRVYLPLTTQAAPVILFSTASVAHGTTIPTSAIIGPSGVTSWYSCSTRAAMKRCGRMRPWPSGWVRCVARLRRRIT